MTFLFEKLDVYQKALGFVEDIEILTKELRNSVSSSFLDQLSRASTSIPLNIAEGNGRWHKGDRKQFFWIARGSAFECLPLLQVIHRRKLIQDDQYQKLYAELDSLAKMLTNLIKSTEKLQRA